ncbi:AMP-binding protein, partial [Actinophytocola sediminis]
MADSIAEVLHARAEDSGSRTAFTVLDDEDTAHPLTYAELDRLAGAVAAAITDVAAPGATVLLMCRPGAEYVAGFFGCLYAGMIAVPAPAPTGRTGGERVLAVLADSGAEVVLVDRATVPSLPDRLAAQHVVIVDEVPAELADDWTFTAPRTEVPAFLQYTSGSTGDPKGVVVGHDNLLHNAEVLRQVLDAGADTVAVSWLPPYHDMGLIGGIVQPVYAGFPAVLLSPMSFLRRPVRWLRAIGEYRATASVAPDFGYAECVRRVSDAELAGLDLSSWRTALVGAEPVRAATLDAFTARFGRAGFRRAAFQPCYGLAEATLFVTGGSGAVTTNPPDAGPPLVGCGHARTPDTVAVVDPDTAQPCQDRTVGEIWVAGPTVTRGYWRADAATREVFGGALAGDPRRFLRTGDLGFLDDGELYVTGRRTELIVLRGRNHYPRDLEIVAQQAHPALLPDRGAAFQVDDGHSARLVLVHEATLGGDQDEVVAAVRAAVVLEHGAHLDDVVLVRRGTLPRTSSGKPRRLAARDRYLRDRFQQRAPVATPGLVPDEPVARTVAEVLGKPVDPDRPLVAQGLDSVRAVELIAELRQRTGLDVTPSWLLAGATVTALAARPRRADPQAPPPAPTGTRPATDGQSRLWLLHEIGAGEA